MDRKLDLRGRAILTEAELRKELAAILALEEAVAVNWEQVEACSLSLLERLPPELERSPEVNHFLDDFDVRQKDTVYAELQRAKLRTYLTKA